MSRSTKATIYLDAIKSNYRLAQTLAPESNNIVVIKANAYGHGLIEVARALEDLVAAFAVALFDEAVLLKEAGINKPILILQGVHNTSELEYATQNNIWLMLHNDEQVEMLCNSEITDSLKVWLKLDSGMHRLGLDEVCYSKNYQKLIKKFKHKSESKIVLCTHFSNASDIETTIVAQQIDVFRKANNNLNSPYNHLISLANSAAIMGFEIAHSDWNRPGIMLYGISPFDQPHPNDSALKTTMSLTSEVVGITKVAANEGVGYGKEWVAQQNSVIATVCIGYADGYPFSAKSGTPVWVAGQKAYLVGRVSMDSITINITDCQGVKVGDLVELWGCNIDAVEVAANANTIAYELFTSVSSRVPRIYN
jgi:alanine racemase